MVAFSFAATRVPEILVQLGGGDASPPAAVGKERDLREPPPGRGGQVLGKPVVTRAAEGEVASPLQIFIQPFFTAEAFEFGAPSGERLTRIHENSVIR